jgi:Fe-S-cluster containining protein
MDILNATTLPEIYAALPTINCRGACHGGCSAILVPPAEAQHMRSKGIEPPRTEIGNCAHLSPAKRCNIYQNRPMICRLFGIVPLMACPFGCSPERHLTEAEEKHVMTVLMQRPKRAKRNQAMGFKP